MSELLDHVDIVVTSLDRSLPFYRALLRFLGRDGETTIEGEHGQRVHYLGGALGVRERQSDYAVFFHDPDGLKLEVVHQP
jgi:catechol 2,3-dioxygenase-like lactoylglutathione lyase family enzyme